MIMYYGGNLICSGDYQGKQWQHCKVMLSQDLQRVSLHKCKVDDALMQRIATFTPGEQIDVSFDFYGNIENAFKVEGGGNHA